MKQKRHTCIEKDEPAVGNSKFQKPFLYTFETKLDIQ